MRRGLEYFGIPRWSAVPINANRASVFLAENGRVCSLHGDVCALHQYALCVLAGLVIPATSLRAVGSGSLPSGVHLASCAIQTKASVLGRAT